ncbi:hypothetical protein NLI96_g4733 [Meripilus lineatus]|uniref:Uncharacterized protein n=1 Tax=Meripilus lineatus TaxID=2056292 RepID=A0AAD5V3Z8_9APHY|nr:hypothetical protein NLI96_g4733 [Physisporinus lineatus]
MAQPPFQALTSAQTAHSPHARRPENDSRRVSKKHTSTTSQSMESIAAPTANENGGPTHEDSTTSVASAHSLRQTNIISGSHHSMGNHTGTVTRFQATNTRKEYRVFGLRVQSSV